MHISLSGEILFKIGVFPVTNTILTTWILMGIIFISVFFIMRSYHTIPSNSQLVLEEIVSALYNAFSSILGEKLNKFFPLLASLFLFIIVCNWSELIPGVGTIGITLTDKVIHQTSSNSSQTSHKAISHKQTKETTKNSETESEKPFDIPLLRAPTADLNTTFAFSIFGMIFLQYWGLKSLGSVTYLSKFISFKDPMSFFVGVLEIISELGKVISFAFRLFGNIFAGEVLLVIVSFLMPIAAPVPFIGLEIFVGFIQALVFSMLLAVFLSIATTKAHH